MFKLFKVLCVLMVLNPAQALMAQTKIDPYTTPPEIDKNYQVPDHMAQAKTLLQRFSLLRKRSQKLTQGKKLSGDVDDLLKNLFLPENARQFRRSYSREINLVKAPRKAYLWLSLARHYTNRGNYQEAATAAYMGYILTKKPAQQAQALTLMGEIYVELGKLADGLNIISKSLSLYDKNDTARRLKVIQERFFLTIQDISVNVEQATPNACIVFSKKLKKGQHAEDYISVTGLADIDINAKGNQICLNGLEFGKTYEVTIKKGLKGANHTLLDHDSLRHFTVNDRDSRASFNQGSYVVSRTQDNMVPLTTVNMDKIKLALYLVHDRNLLSGTDYNLFENIDIYSANNFENQHGSLIWQGEMDIKGARNTEARTLIPLKDMITEHQKGIYILIAREPKADGEPNWRYQNKKNATQWASDIRYGPDDSQG